MHARMPEEFFDELKDLLPPEKVVGRNGGRPPVAHHIVVKVVWFIFSDRLSLGGRSSGNGMVGTYCTPSAA